MKRALRLLRQLLDLALIALVLAVLTIVLAANLGPGLGHQLIVIRGGSMNPAIPLGAVVDVAHVRPDEVRAGDVVTLKAPNGVLVTHRVVRVAKLPDGLYVETKGDANGAADPVLEPLSAMQGRVDFSMPIAGYLMYMLTIPTGIASVFCLAITLLLAVWLLEDLEEDELEDEEETGLELGPAEPAKPSLLDRGLSLVAAPFRALTRGARGALGRGGSTSLTRADAAEFGPADLPK